MAQSTAQEARAAYQAALKEYADVGTTYRANRADDALRAYKACAGLPWGIWDVMPGLPSHEEE